MVGGLYWVLRGRWEVLWAVGGVLYVVFRVQGGVRCVLVAVVRVLCAVCCVLGAGCWVLRAAWWEQCAG